MPDEQIIQLAEKHFDYQGGWVANTEDLLKFALQVADIEYDRGFDDGWGSRADAEQMLAYSKLTDEELAQGHSKAPCDAL